MRVLRPLLAVALLTGCGTGTLAGEGQGGDAPLTPRALAALVATHVEPHAGTPSTGRDGYQYDERDDVVEADVRYGADGESDGRQVAAAVGPDLGIDCAEPAGEGRSGGCEETDRGILLWETETFESDPGYVLVLVRKDDVEVRVTSGFDTITGDPRQQDLALPIDTLFDIAEDERVDRTTSDDAAAADPPWWRED